MICSISVVTCW